MQRVCCNDGLHAALGAIVKPPPLSIHPHTVIIFTPYTRAHADLRRIHNIILLLSGCVCVRTADVHILFLAHPLLPSSSSSSSLHIRSTVAAYRRLHYRGSEVLHARTHVRRRRQSLVYQHYIRSCVPIMYTYYIECE